MPSSVNPSSHGSEKPVPLTNNSGASSVMTSDPPPDDGFKLGRRGELVFFTLAVLALMAALDGTSLSVALPVRISVSQRRHLDSSLRFQTISQKLDGTAIEAFWSGTSFLLSSTGMRFSYSFAPGLSLISNSIPTKLRISLQHFRSPPNGPNRASLLLCWRNRLCRCGELHIYARGQDHPRSRRWWNHRLR